MKDKIIETLKKLDTSNENQWTQEGLPKVDVLKFLSGGESWTREEISEAAPGFTRTNNVLVEGAVNGDINSTELQNAEIQQNQQAQANIAESIGAGTSTEKEQAPQNGATNVVTTKLDVNVHIGLSDVLKSFLKSLDFVNVKELSDSELQDLMNSQTDILSADNKFMSEMNELMRKRAIYLNEVAEEFSRRIPPQSLAEMLSAFHDTVHANASNLPINRPRALQARGPQFFGK